LGKGAIKVPDITDLDVQDKYTKEGLPILGHLFIPIVWPREYKYIMEKLGCYVGLAGK